MIYVLLLAIDRPTNIETKWKVFFQRKLGNLIIGRNCISTLAGIQKTSTIMRQNIKSKSTNNNLVLYVGQYKCYTPLKAYWPPRVSSSIVILSSDRYKYIPTSFKSYNCLIYWIKSGKNGMRVSTGNQKEMDNIVIKHGICSSTGNQKT
jgi:hypothetical protein